MLRGSNGSASAEPAWRMMSECVSNRVTLGDFLSMFLKVKIFYLRPLHPEVKIVCKDFCSLHYVEGYVKSLHSQLHPL